MYVFFLFFVFLSFCFFHKKAISILLPSLYDGSLYSQRGLHVGNNLNEATQHLGQQAHHVLCSLIPLLTPTSTLAPTITVHLTNNINPPHTLHNHLHMHTALYFVLNETIRTPYYMNNMLLSQTPFWFSLSLSLTC